MKNATKIALAASLNIALLTGATSSYAAVAVLGGGMAEECYLAARDAVSGSETVAFTGTRVGLDPVEICTIALRSDRLGVRGLAGTYTNHGVLLFADGKFSAALNNFDKAIDLDESIAEAHINRGASLVALQQWADGIQALTVGLDMDPNEAEKAYYNRAIANEELGNVREAYFDYRKAAELKPEWEEPRVQLTRFTVKAGPGDE